MLKKWWKTILSYIKDNSTKIRIPRLISSCTISEKFLNSASISYYQNSQLEIFFYLHLYCSKSIWVQYGLSSRNVLEQFHIVCITCSIGILYCMLSISESFHFQNICLILVECNKKLILKRYKTCRKWYTS